MMELLSELSSTQVPNVLVIAGIVFLLLALAGKIGANLSVPPEKQKSSAVIGALLLISGVAIFIAPEGSPNDPDKPKPVPTSYERSITDIQLAYTNAALNDAEAGFHLRPELLNRYLAGEALRARKSNIDFGIRNKIFSYCHLIDHEFNNINLSDNHQQAVIEINERWDCAFYSTATGQCKKQYKNIDVIKQKIFLEKRGQFWMIVSYQDLADPDGVEHRQQELIACTEKWPAKIEKKFQ